MSRLSPREHYFVGARELAALLATATPSILLDVRNANGVPDGRPDYEAGHIPGAVYVDLPTELVGRADDRSGAGPLPAVADLQARARQWGISQGDSVVVYDNVAGTKAGRAWFVLRWAGIEDVRILDGGYAAWRAAGLPASTETPDPPPGDVKLSAGHLPVLNADAAASLPEHGVLLDARGADAYRGSADSGGHIPGALSAPTRDNLGADGLLLDEERLRARFAALGADGSRPIGVYCGSGVAAAHQLAVLSSLGVPASLYVGSFTQWSSDPARPVATGSDGVDF
jgi:thiosulfate/3-mercaptopyruvate sulfurtransferase